jgi:chromosome segregation ATPase
MAVMSDKISTGSDIMKAIVKNDEDQRAEIAKLRAEVEQLTHRAAYAERVWKELGASREQLQAEVERLKVNLAAMQEAYERCEERRGTEVERLRAALQGILDSDVLIDVYAIAEKALGQR